MQIKPASLTILLVSCQRWNEQPHVQVDIGKIQETPALVFSCEYCKNFKNSFLLHISGGCFLLTTFAKHLILDVWQGPE